MLLARYSSLKGGKGPKGTFREKSREKRRPQMEDREILRQLAGELGVKESQVRAAAELMDQGSTVPFIARYRREMTGDMTDGQLRELQERLAYERNLQRRKEEVIRLIGEQDKLTPQLEEEIMGARVLQRVEDLYKPFRQKKSTRASKAREKGLLPLAQAIWAQEENALPERLARAYVSAEKEVESPKQALEGAMDILAERIADDPGINQAIREKAWESALIHTEGTDPEESTVYDMYYDHSEPVSRIAGHRVLAINRGEKEKKLKIRLRADMEAMGLILRKKVIKREASPFAPLLEQTIEDALKRLLWPSVEREIRSALTQKAEREAVRVFAENTQKLLMQPPVKDKRVIALDPGYRTGCKVAALDETGKLLSYTTIFPVPPKNETRQAAKTLLSLIHTYQIDLIAIGNGTASRETEQFVAQTIKEAERPVYYTIVSEAGASVYSASRLAQEEYPQLDVTTRGALSIGRRLQDPLAELVKIDPRSIGVGQYQHDVNQSLLEKALGDVVEDCVNKVGVDLNTASPALLSYVSGINASIARSIVAYREENGRFTSRMQLKKVPRLGPKAFEQCAGFLRISGGGEPLDATAVHPESYKAAERVLSLLEIKKEKIAEGGANEIIQKLLSRYPDRTEQKSGEEKTLKGFSSMSLIKEQLFDERKESKEQREKRLAKCRKQLAGELGIGELTLSDILSEIAKPGRDPREDMPQVIFREDVMSFGDLAVGMQLRGTVRNVVDFGAFVDIGVKNDGLVHISEMSERFIRHPRELVGVGDTVLVRIIAIDEKKQKISLSMKGLDRRQ